MMGRTNVVIDDRLVARAMKLARVKTKREAIDVALREFVAQRRKPDLLELFGRDLLDPAYDYRAARAAPPRGGKRAA
jgi:hypothetical protein